PGGRPSCSVPGCCSCCHWPGPGATAESALEGAHQGAPGHPHGAFLEGRAEEAVVVPPGVDDHHVAAVVHGVVVPAGGHLGVDHAELGGEVENLVRIAGDADEVRV